MATRRRFIWDCSALAASAAFVPVLLRAAPRLWREVSLADIGFETLAAQVNSRFLVRDADGSVQALELAEAKLTSRNGRFTDDLVAESFSLFFRGDATRPLGQSTYAFEHSRIGRFEMFIVPVGREDWSGCYYEAIFNRPPPASHARSRAAGHRPIR
jgi:hypothetical protein